MDPNTSNTEYASCSDVLSQEHDGSRHIGTTFLRRGTEGLEPFGAYVVDEPSVRNGSRSCDLDRAPTPLNRAPVPLPEYTLRTPTPPRRSTQSRLCPSGVQTYVVTGAVPSLGMQEIQVISTPPRNLTESQLLTAVRYGNNPIESSRYYPVGGQSVPQLRSNSLALQVSPTAPNRRVGALHATTDTSNASAAGSKGSKRAWWAVNHFHEMHDENMQKCYICVACKTKRSGKDNSSRLAQHLWQCEADDASVKSKLYQDCTHIRTSVRKYGGSFGQVGQNSIVQQPKRRKACSELETKTVLECSVKEADEIALKLFRAMIEFCLPLTIFDSTSDKPNSFTDAFVTARPGFKHSYPTRHKVMSDYLPRLYEKILAAVQRQLKQMLKSGFGTVIFDGWDDMTRSSVVNVLLRVESNSVRKTFFLDSVFTGHARTGAIEYVLIIERAMKEFGGLSRVCGVTSDSARACVNARNELSKRYPGLIGTQDQAHVADLLMKDIGKLPFIKDIVDKVNFLVVETRSKRKLLHFVREEIRREGKRTRAEVSSERRNMGADGSTVPSDPLHPQRLFPPLRRTPIMLKKPATTRFASISDTLESFIRCREVLGKVIFDQRFERDLFPAKKPGHEERRDEYKYLISSSSFLEGVKEVHNVFRLCRRYLRVFDRETETSISDVVPCTDFLDEALNRVPTSDNVLTMERMEEIKALFRRRKDGPISGRGIQVRLIEDLHVAACPTSN